MGSGTAVLYLSTSPAEIRERAAPLDDVRETRIVAAYRDNRGPLLRFLSARLGNAHEAEDLLQELYLKLDRLDGGEQIVDPAAYLYRMAHNLVRDFRRERARAHKREAAWTDLQSTTIGFEAINDGPDAEAVLAAKQRLEAVRAALEELSPQCRRVFLMHKFDGLPHEEVARRAGITRSTVEKHMHTAFKHLISRLGRD